MKTVTVTIIIITIIVCIPFLFTIILIIITDVIVIIITYNLTFICAISIKMIIRPLPQSESPPPKAIPTQIGKFLPKTIAGQILVITKIRWPIVLVMRELVWKLIHKLPPLSFTVHQLKTESHNYYTR